MPTKKTIDKDIKNTPIRSTVPEKFRRALNKPRLRDLTFSDLLYIQRMLKKYYDEDDISFLKTSCSVCTKWRG
jgi:hypothetical protein